MSLSFHEIWSGTLDPQTFFSHFAESCLFCYSLVLYSRKQAQTDNVCQICTPACSFGKDLVSSGIIGMPLSLLAVCSRGHLGIVGISLLLARCSLLLMKHDDLGWQL